MPRQLALDLTGAPAQGRADFIVSDSNRAALAALDGWRRWPKGRLVLTGPAGAGKTHLARLWTGETGAAQRPAVALRGAAPDRLLAGVPGLAVEDAPALLGDPAGERALLHLLNLAVAEGAAILLTGREAPARWPARLPDLASRLASAQLARIALPDDALLAQLLVKLFADRQIRVGPALITYLVARIERSFAAAADAVAALDAAALSRGRPVTRALAREVLDIGAGGAS